MSSIDIPYSNTTIIACIGSFFALAIESEASRKHYMELLLISLSVGGIAGITFNEIIPSGYEPLVALGIVGGTILNYQSRSRPY